MSFQAPDLSEILTNEQTLSTRLTNLQILLREILDDVNVEYSSSDSIIDLIDLFVYVKEYYWQNTTITKAEDDANYGGNYYTSIVKAKLSSVITMDNVESAYWNNAGDSNIHGKFNFYTWADEVETNTAAFGCFTDNGKVTLLKEWNMKIGFIPKSNAAFADSNFAGIGILISGSGDAVSSSSSNYHSLFAGISEDDDGLHPAGGTMAGRSSPNSYGYEDTINLTSGEKYYVEFINDPVEDEITVNFYDDSDNLVYSNDIDHSDIYGSVYMVQTYKIFFGAFDYVNTSSADDEMPYFIICDGYVDADIGGT